MHRFNMAVFVVALLFPSVATAQEARFELGRRLRAFEKEWDHVSDPAARNRTLTPLKQAIASFFTLNLAEAGRGLDLARLSLRAEKSPPAVLWAESCVVQPEKRLLDGPTLRVRLARYYRPRDPLRDGLQFRSALCRADGGSVVSAAPVEVKGLPLTLALPLKDVKPGDYLLRGEVLENGKVLTSSEMTVSVTTDLAARLEKAEKALAAVTEKPSTDSLTAKQSLDLLQKLSQGETLETNYPAARLLHELEQTLATLRAGKPYHGKDRPGQFWLNLAVGTRAVPVRVQVPPGAREGKPLPLVIALHGLGGSENMFFDGYGYGAVARLAAERGWLLATTRNGLTDGVLDELARLYPVDRKKVFLIGHSMGAAQALAAVSKESTRYAGVAALGGGGRVTASDGLRKVACYVGIGKEDFALSGARSLRNSLEKAKVEKLVYREFDDIEHLVIVQECLPDLFKLFDGVR